MTESVGGASPDNRTTMIRGGWIVAFDGHEHRMLRDGVVVFTGDTISFVGRMYDGRVDATIDARGKLVFPGLINSHVHVSSLLGDRMILDEGRRDLYRSGFLNYLPTRGINGPFMASFEDAAAVIKYSLTSLLRFGSTTIVEMGSEFVSDAGLFVNLAGEAGIRLYTCPGYASGKHYWDQGGRHHIHWDERAGLHGLEKAVEFIERYDGSYDGRIRGILVPIEFHVSTHDLLQRTKRAARELGVGITLHLAESVMEFHDTVQATGRSPVAVLRELGFLGPEVILGHCIYVAGHSATAHSPTYHGDLDAIAETGATVAHCPLVFGRRGVTLESFQRYRDLGVNLAIGTDSYPQDIISEMQFASVLAKVTDKTFDVTRARDVFNAATLGGAKALGRDDLGRLAVGAKADIAIADLDALRIGPFIDPIKALIHCGHGDVIDTVIVDGQVLVEGGRLKRWNEAELLRDVRASSESVWEHFGEFHSDNRPLDEAYPNAFKPWMN